MDEYREKRDELKGLLTVQLIAVAEQEGTTQGPILNQLLSERTERLLDRYERLAVEHLKEQAKLLPEPPTYTVKNFCWGMLQGLAASVLFLILIYLAFLLLALTSIDAFAPIKRLLKEPAAAAR